METPRRQGYEGQEEITPLMLFCESEIKQREDNFYKDIIKLYLKYGSVDKVFSATHYDLPISYPGMHHLIKRWGIVKSVGPNSKLSEALTFLTLLTESKMPLEALYKKLPPSFKTSLSTMHRIAHNVKEGVVRRHGTALVVTSKLNEEHVLVGEDLGHRAITLPMTYSSTKEETETSILRVLQQEVFSELAVEKVDLAKLIPQNLTSFMNLVIADIQVSVYKIELDLQFLEKNKFSSYKVQDLRFLPVHNILHTIYDIPIRPGVVDIVNGYQRHSNGELVNINQISNLNLALARQYV